MWSYLGIDLGLATVGNGVVNCDEETKLTLIDYGTILTEVVEQEASEKRVDSTLDTLRESVNNKQL